MKSSAVGWIVLICVICVLFPAEALWISTVQAHQNDALRSIMCFTEKRISQSPQLSEKQKDQALKFYDQALREAHLPPC